VAIKGPIWALVVADKSSNAHDGLEKTIFVTLTMEA
jgi:hypothetical protein